MSYADTDIGSLALSSPLAVSAPHGRTKNKNWASHACGASPRRRPVQLSCIACRLQLQSANVLRAHVPYGTKKWRSTNRLESGPTERLLMDETGPFHCRSLFFHSDRILVG